VTEGWIPGPDGRHHGAHGASVARRSGAPAGGFLDFSQNINPLGTPRGAIEAAHRALDSETGAYPDLEYVELRGALGGYLGVTPENVLPTNGGAEALFLASRLAARGRRGRALILEPTFSEYAAAATAANLEPVRRVVRSPENSFRPDLKVAGDLEGVAAVFLCNPNNPTGDALPAEVVLDLAARAREAGAAFIVDEAFADFAPEVSVARESGEGLYVARSFTKFFAMPGLRLGALVCREVDLARSFQPSWPVNIAAAAAGVAAAGDVAFAERSLAEVGKLRVELASALLDLPGIEVYPSAANFLLARGLEGLVGSLARRGVLVRGCDPFPGLGPGYFRVAVRPESENRRLLAALQEEL
jgi:threonine-phosphate decarboxylase